MPTLYRLYRPQTFAELVGQDHITKTLQQAILKDKVAHAYLFHGPRGTGKTTTARLLAKRMNCLQPAGAEPCTTCQLCTATQEGRNVDIVEIDAASNRGIDDIRALRETIGTSPAMSAKKVYIIDEVHMLTNEAFTALLKTLEEPVGHALFILATTEYHKVPATILSRCQVFRFRRATAAEMSGRLQTLLKKEKRTASGDVLDFIIARSDGCYRDAESLLGQLMTVSDGKITINQATDLLGLPPAEVIEKFITALFKQSADDGVQLIDELYDKGFDVDQFVREVIRTCRDLAVTAAKQEPLPRAYQEVPHVAARVPGIIRALLQALQDFAYVPEPVIALQLAVLTICAGTSPVAPAAPTPPVSVKPVAATAMSVAQSVAKSQSSPAAVRANSSEQKPAVLDTAKVEKMWAALIADVKQHNPVAATFLRAAEPAEINGTIITARLQYALHRNFFEKPEMRELIHQRLTEVAGQKLTVDWQLDEKAHARPPVKQQHTQQEEQLLETVKEVFG